MFVLILSLVCFQHCETARLWRAANTGLLHQYQNTVRRHWPVISLRNNISVFLNFTSLSVRKCPLDTFFISTAPPSAAFTPSRSPSFWISTHASLPVRHLFLHLQHTCKEGRRRYMKKTLAPIKEVPRQPGRCRSAFSLISLAAIGHFSPHPPPE